MREHKLWRAQVANRFVLPEEPVIYPEIELSSAVLRRPMWSGDLPRKRSGFNARIGYWEWELNYHPDPAGFHRIEEFFHANDGFGGFLYHDNDDHHVEGQYLGTGDGSTRRFRLVHKVAEVDGEIVVVEPIGWLDPTMPLTVYVDGVALPPVRYILQCDERGQPFGDQFVDLKTPPQPGQIVTADMAYYFIAEFADDSRPWDNFSRRLRTLYTVNLVSRPVARWPASVSGG